jgi:hypothetical protein
MGDLNVGTFKAICYNYDECRQALAKMIIIDELLFNFMKSPGCRLFCNTMQPRFDVSPCFTIIKDYLKVYVEKRKN